MPYRITALLLLLVLGVRPALADPLAKPVAQGARDHLTRGNRFYGVRSFDEAVAEYKAGALIEPAPVFDYNLGQCFRQSGKYEDAIWHYQRFVTRGHPEGELLDAVNAFVTQMKAELDKKAMTQAPIEPAPAPDVAPAPSSVRPAALPPSSEADERWYHDRIGWSLAGAGVVGLAIGGGLLINASNLNDDANKNPDQRARANQRDRADTRKLAGTVTLIGGGGLLVAGAIKLALLPSQSSRTVSIVPTLNGVQFFGSF